jgi:hypothetical protein
VGEWAFYALVVLLALALLQRFPYRRFFQTHQLLPLVYLALVFHAVVLMQYSNWSEPLGVVMAGLMLAGSAAALRVLFGAVGRSRQAVAVVDGLTTHAATGVLEVAVRLKSRWAGHQGDPISIDQPQLLCGKCHGDKLRDWRDGIHGKRIGDFTSTGKKRWFTCTECHNPHNVQDGVRNKGFVQLQPETPPQLPHGMKNAAHEKVHPIKH